MMNWFPYYSGWLNADGTSELILRCDDAFDRKAAFKIHKAILNAYCERLKARKSQSNGQNNRRNMREQ